MLTVKAGAVVGTVLTKRLGRNAFLPRMLLARLEGSAAFEVCDPFKSFVSNGVQDGDTLKVVE